MFAMQSVSVKRTLVVVTAALTMASGMSARATIDVSQSPLFLPSPVDPNILFVLDDSGSMYWESIQNNWANNGRNIIKKDLMPPLRLHRPIPTTST